MASLLANGLSIAYLRPPYSLPEPLTTLGDQRLVNPALGALLALSLRHEALRESFTERWVVDLRSRFPALPLILRVDRLTPQDALELALRANALHFRAVLIDSAPSRPALRDALTKPIDLGADIVEWLTLRRVRLLPQLAGFVGSVFRKAHHADRLTALLNDAGCPERTARAQCRKVGAVPPGQWLQVARATHAALCLEREERRSLLRLALQLGYHDQSGLIHQLNRLFGLRPSEIRPLLGWECLLDRWLERSADRIAASALGVHSGITCRVEHRLRSQEGDCFRSGQNSLAAESRAAVPSETGPGK